MSRSRRRTALNTAHDNFDLGTRAESQTGAGAGSDDACSLAPNQSGLASSHSRPLLSRVWALLALLQLLDLAALGTVWRSLSRAFISCVALESVRRYSPYLSRQLSECRGAHVSGLDSLECCTQALAALAL
jgi:hypothetical protein